MVYYTSDIHGSCNELAQFCKKMQLTSEDKIPYISDCNKHNSEVGEVTRIHPFKFYSGGDINNHIWKYQMEITFPDGQSIMVDPHRKPSGVVNEVILVESKAPRISLDSVIQFASTRAVESQSASNVKIQAPEPER